MLTRLEGIDIKELLITKRLSEGPRDNDDIIKLINAARRMDAALVDLPERISLIQALRRTVTGATSTSTRGNLDKDALQAKQGPWCRPARTPRFERTAENGNDFSVLAEAAADIYDLYVDIQKNIGGLKSRMVDLEQSMSALATMTEAAEGEKAQVMADGRMEEWLSVEDADRPDTAVSTEYVSLDPEAEGEGPKVHVDFDRWGKPGMIGRALRCLRGGIRLTTGLPPKRTFEASEKTNPVRNQLKWLTNNVWFVVWDSLGQVVREEDEAAVAKRREEAALLMERRRGQGGGGRRKHRKKNKKTKKYKKKTKKSRRINKKTKKNKKKTKKSRRKARSNKKRSKRKY